MKFPRILSVLAATAMFSVSAQSAGYEILFNGKDLSGWKGLGKFWTVQGGAIVGQTTKENPTKGNTFLVWQGGGHRFRIHLQGPFRGQQLRSPIPQPPSEPADFSRDRLPGGSSSGASQLWHALR